MTKWRDPISEAKREGWNEAIEAAEAQVKNCIDWWGTPDNSYVLGRVREGEVILAAICSLTKPKEGGE